MREGRRTRTPDAILSAGWPLRAYRSRRVMTSSSMMSKVIHYISTHILASAQNNNAKSHNRLCFYFYQEIIKNT
jgi:hypothetical protein